MQNPAVTHQMFVSAATLHKQERRVNMEFLIDSNEKLII